MPRLGVHDALYEELSDAWLACELAALLCDKDDTFESLEQVDDSLPSLPAITSAPNLPLTLPSLPTLMEDPDTEVSDAIIDEILQAASLRYLTARKPVLRTGDFVDILFDNKTYRPDAFREVVRVSPAAFDVILAAIKDDAVFTTAPGHTQISIHVQLALLMYRLGHYGNSASLGAVGNLFGLGKGTVVLASNRVLFAVLRSTALCGSVRWPSAEAREASKAEAEARSIPEWRNGWCGVDGTTVPLAEKPLLYGPAWFDRKSRYSMNIQIINDHQMNVIDFSVGRTGSRCDSVAFEDTRLAQQPRELLQKEEWCWADAGYKRQDWLVIPFTRPHRDTAENRQFNFYLSSIRISSEHTIGWLKGRWQCLKELRVKIKTEEDVRYACCWLRAAIVLHQAAKWQEQGNASSDPFYENGRAWEAAVRREEWQGPDAGHDEQQRAAGVSGRTAEIASADKFRDALKTLLLKAKPPRVSRRTLSNQQ